MSTRSSVGRALLAIVSVALCGVAPPAEATIKPRPGVRFPEYYAQRIRKDPRAFTYRRSLQPLAQRIRETRLRMFAIGAPSGAAVSGFAIQGRSSIPVLTLKFSDTGPDPINLEELQRELFDGPWPSGTMTQYYKEISYGRFEVTGQVQPFRTLKNKGSFYAGNCNGLCPQAKVPQMLTETLTLNASLDWGQFDNEGPDGKPNSGDDDGFVDFVAFVQPDTGGECGRNPHIWSHRFNLSGWGAKPFATKSPRTGGGTIMVDDYVIMPAKACDGKTMIQIGVFAHEFGHAFGLPDLYDTDDSNGESEGAGNWCLMAGGSWGGDGNSPQRPTHMSVWSKTFLGWVLPSLQTTDVPSASIPEIESNAFAIKVPISMTQYYLVENRQRTKFDDRLPTGGMLIWRINDTVVNAGLATNSVNANENNQGVELVEADGRKDLDAAVNRGDAGDPFPGSRNVRAFDNTTKPSSVGKFALCDISGPGPTMTGRISITGRCQTTAPTPVPSPQLAPTGGTSSSLQGRERDAQPPDMKAIDVTISELQKNPTTYADKRVRVSGILENEGTNYFTDRRLVLRETTGSASVPVQWPGMPLSVPPRPPGSSRARPPVLSDYLGKDVQAVGVFERTAGRDGVSRYTLTIQTAVKRDPPSPNLAGTRDF